MVDQTQKTKGDKAITEQTLTAIKQLAKALIANPKDVQVLKIYGDLPSHLVDALEDYS